jgi:replicative DNA helicase
LLELAQKAAKLSSDQSLPAHELLAQFNQEVAHFLDRPVDAQERVHHIGDVALQLCTDDAPRLFRTGFAAFDALLGGGMRPGTMIVVAGRPGMGKSAFGLSLALNLARAGTKTVFASIEMSARECAARLLANLSGVESRLVYRLESITEHERDRVYAALEVLNNADLYIAERDVDTPAGIRSLVASTKAQVVVVDYLQHMQYSRSQRSRYQSRQEEVASISLALKRLTREYGVVMVALAQLNRLVELRSSAAPQLSDLRDSGQIEQDADAVLFLDRKDLRYTEDEWAKRFPLKPYPRGIVQVSVAKNRSGPVGEFELAFVPQYSRFLNTAPTAHSQDTQFRRRVDEEEEDV